MKVGDKVKTNLGNAVIIRKCEDISDCFVVEWENTGNKCHYLECQLELIPEYTCPKCNKPYGKANHNYVVGDIS